ncbi:MAG: tetratricopeptide repeat protein [Phycisphaerales bacterium]|jgi:tetratricopeptide (TPR) repeat protein
MHNERRMNSTTQAAKLALLAGAVVGAMALTGCSGNGRTSAEARNAAAERMAGMKSGTEWDMARQAFLSGDPQKALDHIDRSIALNDGVVRSHVLRGRIMMELGNFEESMASLGKAEVLDPEDVDTQYFLGVAYERIGEKEQAMERYQAAAELDTARAIYAVAAAEMLIDIGRTDDAESYLKDRLDLYRHNAGIRQTLGHIAMMRGDAVQASDWFTEARFLAPDDPGVLEDLARAELAAGRFAEAEFNLAELMNMEGFDDRRDLQHMRARCLVEVDRPVEARDVLVSLTEGDGGEKDLDAWIQLGHVCYQLRDMARVRRAAGRVIALAPQRSEGYLLRALQQRGMGDLDAALQSLDLAIQRSEGDASPLILRGLIAQQAEMPGLARSSFEAAQKLDPSNENVARMIAALDAQYAETFATIPDDGQ